MAIYTKKGDNGMTVTFNSKKKLLKSSQIFKTLGAIDEANSYLGIILSLINPKSKFQMTNLGKIVEEIQRDLMTIGSIVAGADLRFSENKTKELERIIDKLDSKLPPLKNFILPGGGEVGAHLMYARTLVRRAERELVAQIPNLNDKCQTAILRYINRLSDFLFVLARYENKKDGMRVKMWKEKGSE